ncbi:hypothetical protein ACI2VE_18265 [Ralstonia nicotianae]
MVTVPSERVVVVVVVVTLYAWAAVVMVAADTAMIFFHGVRLAVVAMLRRAG